MFFCEPNMYGHVIINFTSQRKSLFNAKKSDDRHITFTSPLHLQDVEQVNNKEEHMRLDN